MIRNMKLLFIDKNKILSKIQRFEANLLRLASPDHDKLKKDKLFIEVKYKIYLK